MDIITLALCKKYVAQTAEALGAVKGAPCTIKSVQESLDGKTITITFSWMSNTTPSTEQTTEITLNKGSLISINQIITQGNKIAEITIDGETTELFAPTVSGGTSELTTNLDATVSVGGVISGKHYNTGTSLEDILRDILSPIVYPTLNDPSASLSATGNRVLEKGSTFNATLTTNFNRGSINPAYGTSGYRTGAATSYALNGSSGQTGNVFEVVVSESNYSYYVTVNYAAGDQPKDSAGNNYSTPYAAGSINTNTITYEFVDALWANTASANEIAKLALVSKTDKQKVFNFPMCAAATPEIFDIPTGWTISAIEAKNELTGEYEDCSSEFTVSSTTHNSASGTTTNYTRYTNNLGYDMGARDIRIKWA